MGRKKAAAAKLSIKEIPDDVKTSTVPLEKFSPLRSRFTSINMYRYSVDLMYYAEDIENYIYYAIQSAEVNDSFVTRNGFKPVNKEDYGFSLDILAKHLGMRYESYVDLPFTIRMKPDENARDVMVYNIMAKRKDLNIVRYLLLFLVEGYKRRLTDPLSSPELSDVYYLYHFSKRARDLEPGFGIFGATSKPIIRDNTEFYYGDIIGTLKVKFRYKILFDYAPAKVALPPKEADIYNRLMAKYDMLESGKKMLPSRARESAPSKERYYPYDISPYWYEPIRKGKVISTENWGDISSSILEKRLEEIKEEKRKINAAIREMHQRELGKIVEAERIRKEKNTLAKKSNLPWTNSSDQD